MYYVISGVFEQFYIMKLTKIIEAARHTHYAYKYPSTVLIYSHVHLSFCYCCFPQLGRMPYIRVAAFFHSRGVLCYISEMRLFFIAGVFSAIYPRCGFFS